MTCEICTLQSNLRIANLVTNLGPDWAINPYQGGGHRPRWVIQANRHSQGLHELNHEELTSMGVVMGLAIRTIHTAVPEIVKVYAFSFNETGPGHPHMHLVPRFEGEYPDPYSLPEPPRNTYDINELDICHKVGQNLNQMTIA